MADKTESKVAAGGSVGVIRANGEVVLDDEPEKDEEE